jgi:CubicO group peptidase (beta-lactamase class C family)
MKILIFSVSILITSITAFSKIALFMNNTKKVDSLLKSVYADDLPGASVAIVRDGKVIFKKSYGVREIN